MSGLERSFPPRPWTPGPWEANERGSDVIAPSMPSRPRHVMDPDTKKMIPVKYDTEPRTWGYGCGNQFVCDLNDGEYHEYTDHAEQKANARLIALAPEMAEAMHRVNECGCDVRKIVYDDTTGEPRIHMGTYPDPIDCPCWDYFFDVFEKLESIGKVMA